MELLFCASAQYRVKSGQHIAAVAKAFSVPATLLCRENGLSEEPFAGQILTVPQGGDLYCVRGGETKTLLCGSDERFAEKNGTSALFPGQTVCL